ncbi:MAG: hypothetical protein Q4E61_01565 [Alphaproteobacteria bacterium]|nr:hypothetical protein [Alphaproteobacteria bacterium]
MNKFTKLLLSGALLVAPSYGSGSTGFQIDANLDYSAGGTLNVNVNATLENGKTITLGEDAVGNIKAEKTLTNNGTIEYKVKKDESGIITGGVFKAEGGVIDQGYDAGKVKGSIKLNEITYSVNEGALLDENTTNTLADIGSLQKVLFDGYSGGKMSPDLAKYSAPIKYTKDGTTYTFGENSVNGYGYDNIPVTGDDADAQKADLKKYLEEFGISATTTSASKTTGNSRIQALAGSTAEEAILIPDDIDNGNDVIIEMAAENKTISGNLHNTGQNDTIKFTKPAEGDAGLLTLSGNNSYLKNIVEFGALNAGVPVKFDGLNSIPGKNVNCYGDVSTGDSGANLPATATLTIKGDRISGQINASANSTINIGAPLP